jgi:cellulose synthase/poly-beta-1,6-N-acetylglucosamine synthase-like glycosyltransferase
MISNLALAISPETQSLITLVMMALILTLFYYAILKSIPPSTQEVLTTKVIVRCINEDHEEQRAFQKGMYIGKILDEKCPKCSSSLYIHRIYAENMFEEKTTKKP